ncbi:MAG: autotransporter-associated beta strand repeat-containing protein [Verrucomicrobiota bacterium]
MKPSHFLSLPLLTTIAVAQLPAFPGAEGYGAYAKGGRGGDVYHVTNLNTSGVGSFADAIATVPALGRTIVFDVSGHIHVNKTTLSKSNVTIAGQTAPGDGIGFKDGTFIISGDDIVIRHARFRYGRKDAGGDCIDLSSGTLNAILDQVSIQFSTDENISSFGSPPENLTMQWSLNGWGLESHSCGGLWDQNHATSHHSLWAHNHTRNPKARPNGLLEWVNNITYDWDIGFIMGDSNSNASWKSNVRGCYFLCPPGNLRPKALEKANLQTSNGLPNFSLYLDNCLHDADGDGLLNGTNKGYGIASGSYNTNPTPFAATGALPVTIDAPLLAFKKVLSKGGALRPEWSATRPLHDEVDAKMINNVLTQTRNHISSETQLGLTNGGFGTLNSVPPAPDTDRDGMPDYWETAIGLNVAVDDHNGQVPAASFIPNIPAGYTHLEEYLHFKASPHAVIAKSTAALPTFVDVDLRRYTVGFAATSTFTTGNPLLGTAVLQGDGHTVRFTPAQNSSGRARFDFTVNDAGVIWTQTFYLMVTTNAQPRNLKWQGGLSGNDWDTTTNNWLNGAAVTAFSTPDNTFFDDTGSLTPAVNLPATVSPGSVTVNAAGNYTFGGAGGITSTGTLTKSGTGTLTINNTGTNSFVAATLNDGMIALGNEAANNSGLGTGPLTMNSGTLNMYNTGPGGSYTGSLPNPLVVNGDVDFNAAARCGTSGALSGAGTLNLFVPFTRTDWGGNPALFNGTLKVTTDADGCEFRINNGGTAAVTDYGGARLVLADKVNAYFLPNPPSGGDKTQIVEVGELTTSGTGAGVYLGGASGAADRIVHWKVGALNTSTTFGGVIQNRTGPAALTKLGTGSLTLTGASTATGATTVAMGKLLVNGSLGGTPTTVASGATLGGAGSIGGQVTLQSGATVSPGASSGALGPLTAAGGFSATGTTFVLDLTSNPADVINDKVLVTGGSSSLGGTITFQVNFANGILGPGDYKLVECGAAVPFGVVGGMAMVLSTNAPAGTRQTFALNRSASGTLGGNARLTVTGNAADLLWVGALNSATWDLNTTANFTGAASGTFYNLDAVTFDDTSANRSVTLAGSLAPRSALVNTTAGYTLGGAGSLDGTGALVKNGTGNLAFAGTAANTFSGGLTLNAGTITLGNDTANNAGLGTGPVTMNAGVISMHDNDSSYNAFTANLVVPAGATVRLNADSRVDLYGTLAGAGTLNFYAPWVRTTLFTDWSAFTGTINVLTDAGGGDFRMGTSYGFPGFPQAAIALTDKVWAYYTGTLAAGAGTTIEIGELSGTSTSVIQGGATGGRALTYRIGGRNTNATFAGTISEQNAGTATSYVKTGTGIWTLGGTGIWNGGTTVEQGTLKITNSITCASAVNVAGGAALHLTNGTIATDVVNLDAGASMVAYGTLASDLNSNGTFDGRGFGSGTPGTLAVSGSAFFGSSSVVRLRGGVSSDGIAITGDLSLAGTIQVALAPGTAFGRYPLMTYGGNLELGAVILTGIPGGTTAKLSTSVAGRVDLVIDDSDEDALPDSWEIANLGNLSSGPADDSDGDGQSNAIEHLAGTHPKNGSSRFAATMTPGSLGQFTLTWPSVPGKNYAIETNVTLTGTWSPLIIVPAATSPATTTSYPLTPAGSGNFYRVVLRP